MSGRGGGGPSGELYSALCWTSAFRCADLERDLRTASLDGVSGAVLCWGSAEGTLFYLGCNFGCGVRR